MMINTKQMFKGKYAWPYKNGTD